MGSDNNQETGQESVMTINTPLLDNINTPADLRKLPESDLETLAKELRDFLEQLSSKQFKEIETFFETMPKLRHELTIKNPNTGVESDVVLEGLAAFFG